MAYPPDPLSVKTEHPLRTAHRKLVAGTEVLRTGGGTTLSVAECNAVLDELEILRSVFRSFIETAQQAIDGKLPEQGYDPSRRDPEDLPR